MMARSPLRVFYSYSHHDRRMLERLYAHMVMLRREGLITEWYDGAIDAGSEWRDEIARELEAADVILLLVSADFLASEFCYEQEMLRAVERAHRGDALVIGVMMRAVAGWERSPFAEFQVVPQDGRPVSKWSNADDAYRHVVERIRSAIGERLEAGSRARSPAHRSPARGRRKAAAAQPAQREPRSQATPPADDDVLNDQEVALLARIADPEQRELQRQQMIMQKQAFIHQITTNLAMRGDIRKAVAKNMRA
jgi:TIR domain